MNDVTRRRELARFLRARRSALQPAEAGLTNRRGRRRTPGLRREGGAERAAISVSWYTRLEQGRDIHVSDATLDSLATSLRLDPAEREYLHKLARASSTGGPACGDGADLPARVQRILDAHEPNPGYVIDRKFDLIAWNRSALRVFGDFSIIPRDERNVLRMLFGMLRLRIVNWEPNARFVIGAFRASTSEHVNEPWFTRLVTDLSRDSTEFRCWWSEYNVERPVAYKKIRHPLVGDMVLEQTSLLFDDGSARRLIFYTPMPNTGAEAKLKQLVKCY